MPLATRHMIDKVTYWTKTTVYDPDDPYKAESWSSPVTISCEYMTGGNMQRDVEGVEFQPSATFYTIIQLPFGARVVVGLSTSSTPPRNAEIIRKTGTGTKLRGLTEYEAFTG